MRKAKTPRAGTGSSVRGASEERRSQGRREARLDAARRRQDAAAERASSGASRPSPDRTSTSGFAFKTYYETSDLPADLNQRVPPPGQPPFTRGIHPAMYRERLWTMRQYAGFGNAQQTNRRFRYLLAQGQTGLSVAFDLPTQMGYDSDHPAARGEVGKVGVAISCLADMESLLEELPLDRVTTSMTINATAPLLLAFYVAVADARGLSRASLGGTVQNDVLKEYIARGTYIYPVRASLRLITDVFEFTAREVPQWNSISVSGYHMREAGSTAVQEVAFTIANGLAYLEAARERGLDPARIARRISFVFNAHNHRFEEVAKFRAARALWADLLRERFGITDDEARKLRFHTQTAGSMLTAQQPLTNVARTTVQGLAAVLGGTQSLHTNSYDEALGLPSEDAALLALRTQQVLAHESGVPDVADPLAGSYFVESLTAEIDRRSRVLIGQIDAMGGMLAAIERGWVQEQIHRSAYEWQRQVESGELVVVGVNRFAEDAPPPPAPSFRLDAKVERERARALAQWRSERDGRAVIKARDRLDRSARGDEHLMPPILAAVVARVTLGEICDTLRGVFGTYRPAGAHGSPKETDEPPRFA
jgi:methylmalonyl-CoA mutase N-terminal domain/subunit